MHTMKKKRHGPGREEADIRAIKRLAAAWRSGWLSGDADALVALYAKDAVLMPEGHAAITKRRTIRDLYRAVLAEFSITSIGKLMRAEASGDLGYFCSTYRLTATPKRGGRPTRSRGKSLFVVKRQPDGGWKIVCLVDNSDAEVAAGKDER